MNYDEQYKLLDQQRARYIQQQNQQAPQGSMVGSHFVAANPLEYLAAGLRSYGGFKGEQIANQKLGDLQKQKQEAIAKALRTFGEKANPQQIIQPDVTNGAAAPVKPDMYGAYNALASSGIPQLQQIGMQGFLQIPQMHAAQQEREDARAFRQQEAQSAREARAQELQIRMQDARLNQQDKLAAQRELQQMQIDARKDMQRMIASARQAPQAQIIQTDSGPMQLIDGRAMPIVGPDGKQVAAPKKEGMGNATEGERKAATLLQRMQSSQAQLENALKTNPSAAKPGVISSGLRSAGMETMANLATPESRQQVEAAQLDILDAALTLGTGAAYTKEQLEGYRKSYFPQVGDTPKNIKDKQDRLNNVLSAARIAAGRAAGQVSAPIPPSNIDALLEKYK